MACSKNDASSSSDSNITECNVAGVTSTTVFGNVVLEDVPTALVFAPKSSDGRSHQAFVTQQLGVVKTFDPTRDGAAATVFADMRKIVNNGGQREPGVNGLIVHPQWPAVKEVYITYDGFLANGGFEWRFSRFTSRDGLTLDLGSEKILIRADKPAGEHNGGEMKFHPTEVGKSGLPLLYLSVGDSEDAFGPRGNAQNLNTPLGKIHRIDIMNAKDRTDAKQFDTPDDNPFNAKGEFPPVQTQRPQTGADGVAIAQVAVGNAQGLASIYSWGHRNPWRFTFDTHNNQTDMWEGEIGQDAFEEVNLVKKAHNYGWNIKEALHTQNFCNRAGATKCVANPLGKCGTGDRCDRAHPTITEPVLEVPHPSAVQANDPLTAKAGGYAIRSLTGGFIYRGKNSKMAKLVGKYIYGDFANGGIYASTPDANGALSTPIKIGSAAAPTSFALDDDGEILVTTFGGAIQRLAANGSCPTPPDPNALNYVFLSKSGIATFREGLDYLVTANADVPALATFKTPATVPTDPKDYGAFIAKSQGPDLTLKQWQDQFMKGETVSALYQNDLDLGFWRQMTCTKNFAVGVGGCAVTNWPSTKNPTTGAQLSDPTTGAAFEPQIKDLVLENDNLGTVTMNVSPEGFTRFYVFAGPVPHKIQPFAVLDGEGGKVSPSLCTPCHSGAFSGDKDVGSVFREFEPSALKKHSSVSTAVAEQQWFDLNQAIKQANRSIKGAAGRALTGGPSAQQAVLSYVDSMYPKGAAPAVAVGDPSHLPASYVSSPAGVSDAYVKSKKDLYTQTVGPYCMGCHRYNNTNLNSYQFLQGLTANAGAHSLIEAYILPDPADPKRQNLAQMPQANFQLFKLQRDPNALPTLKVWLAQELNPTSASCLVTFNLVTDINSPVFDPNLDSFHVLGQSTAAPGAPPITKDPLSNFSANLGGITLVRNGSTAQGNFIFSGQASFPQGASLQFKATVGQDERQRFELFGQGNRAFAVPAAGTADVTINWAN